MPPATSSSTKQSGWKQGGWPSGYTYAKPHKLSLGCWLYLQMKSMSEGLLRSYIIVKCYHCVIALTKILLLSQKHHSQHPSLEESFWMPFWHRGGHPYSSLMRIWSKIAFPSKSCWMGSSNASMTCLKSSELAADKQDMWTNDNQLGAKHWIRKTIRHKHCKCQHCSTWLFVQVLMPYFMYRRAEDASRSWYISQLRAVMLQ